MQLGGVGQLADIWSALRMGKGT